MNTVILITDYNEIKTSIQENLLLLRKDDKVLSTDYDNAVEVLQQNKPSVVIIHENDIRQKTVDLIVYIRSKKTFKSCGIILLTEVCDKEFILKAYDAGIDDYVKLNSENFEILIRTINAIKKFCLQSKIAELYKCLEKYGITNPKNGFYSHKLEYDIVKSELENPSSCFLTYITIFVDYSGDVVLDSNIVDDAIKNSVRIQDIVFESVDNKYNLILNTDIDGTIKIYEKIRSLLEKEVSLKAGITTVDGLTFEEIKSRSICALNKALLSNEDYVVYSVENYTDNLWLETPKENYKTYKFLKNIFCNKLEKIIKPIFSQMQEKYQKQLDQAKIEQFTDIEQSVFRIIMDNHESRLVMRYPAYEKLVIKLTHSGFDTPEDKNIEMPITSINQDTIIDLLENFVSECMAIYKN